MKLYLDSMLKNITLQEVEDLGYQLQSEPDQETEVIVSSRVQFINHSENYPSLKFVQLTSAGFDFVDLESLFNKGIKVSNARGVYSLAIAEFVVARLLEVNNNLRSIIQDQTKSDYNRDYQHKSLSLQKGAILGTGSIALECAKLLKPFHPTLHGFNTKGTQHDLMDECFPLSEFDQLSSEYDFIIITLPLNQDTKHYINKERLMRLKEDCVLINIARGPIIDEQALIEVLDNHLKAVVLDVFEKEPLDKESKLWNHTKTYLSPHISFKNDTSTQLLKELVIKNLKRYKSNEELLNAL